MPKPPPADPSKRDYRATLFLPATDFPMKAGLAAAEPAWLARWEKMDLYGRLRAAAKGRPLFLLHDGPPYANGDIHIGTALNKILKDFVVRSQTMLGKDAPYVPGWDCHGLPIEWKIEEEYRAAGKSKDEVPVLKLRADCRAFAKKWIGVQREQFKRLGCIGDWERPYTTMAFAAEAQIVRELHKFAMNGLLYRGSRPVMWSPVEKTALAEAEIEYHEKQSPTIYVKFPIVNGPDDASVVIWTTTPWTIPGNRAIAYSKGMSYGLYEVAKTDEGSLATAGERVVLANDLAEQTAKHCKLVLKRLGDINPEGLICRHPLHGYGYDFDVPLLPGEHVTADTGTGFVHTAPGHGEEDFNLGRAHGLEVPFTVGQEGEFLPNVPIFAGKHILTPEGNDGDANGAVIKELIAHHALLGKGSLRHQYPHSWRSKAPVIFRATPQWFIAVDKEFTVGAGNRKGTLREIALAAIAETKWYPPAGENRIGAMVRERPDWVLSRQRAWGVPIAVFVSKRTGELLRDEDVNARIAEAFGKEGADAWFTSPPSRFLGPDHKPDDYEQITDILDVWFESGTTHAFVVEHPVDPAWPKAAHADLYLEGSDQHRGWFQSSLLESCGTLGRAPYDAVLTHGFALDEQGRKMSKSLGNTVAPQTVAETSGAEILRLWAASSDFTEDLRIGLEIIKANVDGYRRLRNTIRFMLANLSDFDEAERIGHDTMPELERFMLARLAQLDAAVREGYARYDFTHVYTTLFNFATGDLSAFYFDVRKDALYCDAKTSVRRRAARTVLDALFNRVVTWLAPVLCFTMEEVWTTRFGADDSVHLQTFPETPKAWEDPALLIKWESVRNLRRVVTGGLEVARRDKTIGASLEAVPTLYLVSPASVPRLDGLDLAELFITSGANLEGGHIPPNAFRLPDVPDAGVTVAIAKDIGGNKCERCWRVLPEVGRDHPDLCHRCTEVVK
jgi:isoleucyl-tRNA synthetase